MNPLESFRQRTQQKLLDDFASFARRGWKEIEPKPLVWNWSHQAICEYLQACFGRKIKRLIITVPPRNTKSRLTSVLWPAWIWARDASQSVVLTSYSDSLSEELNVLRRNLLQSEWFRSAFPNRVMFRPDANRREQYANTAGGVAIATSTEGALTGKGGDILICDDLLSPQQGYSDLLRENANRYFDSTLRSRLNEPENGCVVIICQRLHEMDVVGHVLTNEPGVWEHLSLEMECEEDKQIYFPVSGRTIERKQGDLLHPARFGRDWCTKTRLTVGNYIWSSQYQQRPGVLGGAVFQRTWFQSYKKDPPEGKGVTILSLDTAYSTRKTADYSVASVWTAYEGRYYLRFIWRARADYPSLKRTVEDLCTLWNPESVIIEEKASGQSLLQSLQQETILPIVAIPADSDKTSRAHGITSLFESGRVFFPEQASWLSEFLHELELFPSGAHDDQVDSMVHGLSYLRKQTTQGGLTLIAGMIERGPDWLRGIFKKKSASGSKPAAVAADCKPPVVTVDNVKIWMEQNKTPACPNPNCKSPCTFLQRDCEDQWHLHCRQCGGVDGVLPPKPIVDGICPVEGCGIKLQLVPGGGVRCMNHGQLTFPSPDRGGPKGISRREHFRRLGQFAIRPRGRF
jgi:predicted phage terminase large subunit-like protein